MSERSSLQLKPLRLRLEILQNVCLELSNRINRIRIDGTPEMMRLDRIATAMESFHFDLSYQFNIDKSTEWPWSEYSTDLPQDEDAVQNSYDSEESKLHDLRLHNQQLAILLQAFSKISEELSKMETVSDDTVDKIVADMKECMKVVAVSSTVDLESPPWSNHLKVC